MTKALVTGGAGFIGSHVADLMLSEGWDVTVVDDLSSGKMENIPASASFHEIGMTSADLARLV
jgi:UDP-glucose 4-epimerase